MKNFQEDFEEFCSSHEIPPVELRERIVNRVRFDLEPSQFRVFLKLLALHIAVSVGTLSLCPQFGFRLFGSGMGLMGFFMKFGAMGCMSACGAIFLGTSLFLAPFALTHFELKTVERMKFIHLGLLTGFSLAFFASVDAYLSLELVLSWGLGAFLGAYGALEMAQRLKSFAVKI